MRKLFKRSDEDLPTYPFLYAMTNKVTEIIGHIKMRIAKWLRLQFERLSMREKKVALLLYFICFAGLSILIIVQTLSSQGSKIKIPLSLHLNPTHIGMPSKNSISPSPPMPFASYSELIHLLHLTDSLSPMKDGKQKFDSILKANPALMDTLSLLEKSIPKHKNR